MLISKHFKNYFLRGLAVLLPALLTIWIFIFIFQFIQKNISVYINYGLVKLIVWVPFILPGWSEEALVNFWVEGPGSIAGFVIGLISTCIVGALLASVVGKTLWRMVEKFIMNIPFLKKVYPYVKQITDYLFTKNRLAFSRVVAFEYPMKGSWSLGFVTGTGIEGVNAKTGKEYLTVFLPTSPTPFTGFVVMVPKKNTIELDISIEEAMRFIISGGVITPDVKLNKSGTLVLSEDDIAGENTK